MEQVLAAGRNELLRLAGQGCNEGEQLVARLAFGSPARARPVARSFTWRPAAGAGRCTSAWICGASTSPGCCRSQPRRRPTLTCSSARSTPAASCCRGRPHRGRVRVRRHVTETVSHLRDQAAASYSRAVDPTPLAGVRPGAVAAAVAGCLAVGGGATYCVEQGVDPIAGIRTIASREQPDRSRSRISVGCVSRRPRRCRSPRRRSRRRPRRRRRRRPRSPRSRRASRRHHNRRVHPHRRRRRRRIRADRGREQQRIGQFAAGVGTQQTSARAGGWPERVRWPMSTDRERRIMRTRRAGRSIAAAIVLSIVLAGTSARRWPGSSRSRAARRTG